MINLPLVEDGWQQENLEKEGLTSSQLFNRRGGVAEHCDDSCEDADSGRDLVGSEHLRRPFEPLNVLRALVGADYDEYHREYLVAHLLLCTLSSA